MTATLVRNFGLELPTYDESTPVAWTKEDIKAAAIRAAEANNGSFVRRTVLRTPYFDANLKDTLDAADKAIIDLCRFVDAYTIPYQWGLYQGEIPQSVKYDSVYNSRLSGRLSKYALVASVAAPVAKPEIDYGLNADLTVYTSLYSHGQRHTLPLILGDVNKHQFIQEAGEEDYATLVDIEPRLVKPF